MQNELKGEERGMIKIFIGAILALLDFTVTNGSMRFGILPDFIWFVFLLYSLVLRISWLLIRRHANDWRQQGQRCLY